MLPDQSTLPYDDGLRAGRRDRFARRIALVIIAAVVAVGASGWLGVKSGTIHREAADGTTIDLVYPQVARPGLAVPWRLLIDAPQGFATGVRITLTSSYVASFDHNDLNPDPSSIERDDTAITYVFDEAPGTRFEMAFDMSVEPGVQWKRSSSVRITLGDDQISEFDLTTWVLP